MANGRWQSYDSVATAYDRLWRPNFERIARDLVDAAGAVRLPDDAAILDVGTGSGGVAIEALRTGPRGFVIGVDPSAPMLHLARANAPLAPVAAACPGLPFRGGTFHAVLANVVLSHFERYDTALADMVRVLRPEGRLGVTAWGSLDDEPVDDGQQRELTGIWKSVADRFVDVDAAAEEIETAIPWEGWFGDPAHLRGALEASGVRDVALHARIYRADVTQRDMIAGYETSFWGALPAPHARRRRVAAIPTERRRDGAHRVTGSDHARRSTAHRRGHEAVRHTPVDCARVGRRASRRVARIEAPSGRNRAR